jgi:hypothetical protein
VYENLWWDGQRWLAISPDQRRAWVQDMRVPLQERVDYCARIGYRVVSQTDHHASLSRRSPFNWLWFLLWSLTCFGWVIYLIYYLTKPEEVLVLYG